MEVFIAAWVARQPSLMSVSGPDVEFNSLDVQSHKLTVKNRTDKELPVIVLPPADEYFGASLSADSLAANGEVTVTISKLKPLPLGKFVSSVTVEVGEEDAAERFSVPITGTGYLE
jgi:hypothetical protein